LVLPLFGTGTSLGAIIQKKLLKQKTTQKIDYFAVLNDNVCKSDNDRTDLKRCTRPDNRKWKTLQNFWKLLERFILKLIQNSITRKKQ